MVPLPDDDVITRPAQLHSVPYYLNIAPTTVEEA